MPQSGTTIFSPFTHSILRGIEAAGDFAATFCKGDIFYHFLFALLHIISLLKID